MIVVRLIGRLANQMFQYAAGRAVALRLGTDLALDNRIYEGIGWDALSVFRIRTVPVARDRLPPQEKTLLRHWLARAPGRFRPRRELHIGRRFYYSPWLRHAADDSYLMGYFQDRRYFADHIETVRAELTPHAPPSANAAEWMERIMSASLPVSVHVRRGDFVDTGLEQPAEYYITRMARIPGAAFFVFSDDPQWCAANLPGAAVVTGNGEPDDFRLMAACRAHIGTPGSSFSAWGGLLQSGS